MNAVPVADVFGCVMHDDGRLGKNLLAVCSRSRDNGVTE
jgi:hypothetical protein